MPRAVKILSRETTTFYFKYIVIRIGFTRRTFRLRLLFSMLTILLQTLCTKIKLLIKIRPKKFRLR